MNESEEYCGLNQTPPHQISKRTPSSVDLYHFSASYDTTTLQPPNDDLYNNNTNFSETITPERKKKNELYLNDDSSILPKNSRSPATHNEKLSRLSSLEDYSRLSEIRKIDDDDETPRVASVELRLYDFLIFAFFVTVFWGNRTFKIKLFES